MIAHRIRTYACFKHRKVRKVTFRIFFFRYYDYFILPGTCPRKADPR